MAWGDEQQGKRGFAGGEQRESAEHHLLHETLGGVVGHDEGAGTLGGRNVEEFVSCDLVLQGLGVLVRVSGC